MENWTTRLNPELSRRYGVEELHNVFFEPEGWEGRKPSQHQPEPSILAALRVREGAGRAGIRHSHL
jgi:hypothetical protein